MDVDILDFETAGADVVLTKPMRLELLGKVLEYCHTFGCLSIDRMSTDMLSISNKTTPPTHIYTDNLTTATGSIKIRPRSSYRDVSVASPFQRTVSSIYSSLYSPQSIC